MGNSESFLKGGLIYEGKAKLLYLVVGREELIWQEYKDSLTAFNAQKKGNFPNKGALNREISALLFEELEKNWEANHRVAEVAETEELKKKNAIGKIKLSMVKLELVVRNVLAGSTAKKFGIEEGAPLVQPLVEFYYKDDALGDPFVSDEQAIMLKAAQSKAELEELKAFAFFGWCRSALVTRGHYLDVVVS